MGLAGLAEGTNLSLHAQSTTAPSLGLEDGGLDTPIGGDVVLDFLVHVFKESVTAAGTHLRHLLVELTTKKQ